MRKGSPVACVASALAFVLISVSPGSAHAEAPVLQATAGLGGAAKAGRWTPVSVVIASPDAIDGDLVLSWRTTRLRRAVAIPPRGAWHFELYLRTTEVEGSIGVRLESGGRSLHTLDLPVRVLSSAEPFTLCVQSSLSLVSSGSTCSSTVTSDRLPLSPRGYDAVDRVVWADDGWMLTAEQHAAFEQWTALRRLEDSGDLALTSQVSRPLTHRLLPSATARVVAGFSVAYAAGLILAGFFVASGGAPLRRVAAMFVGVTLLASAGAAAIGRAGPGLDVEVRHQSLLQQIPGTHRSLLTMRGIAQFPAFDTYSIRLPVMDAMFEVADGANRSEQALDVDGHPVIAGVFGLGTRQAFAVEAISDVQPLALSWKGRTATVANRSDFRMRSCRFADRFSDTRSKDLAPGARVSADQVTEAAGPVFTCLLPRSLVDLTEAARGVTMTGTTTLALYRVPPPLAETTEVVND